MPWVRGKLEGVPENWEANGRLAPDFGEIAARLEEQMKRQLLKMDKRALGKVGGEDVSRTMKDALEEVGRREISKAKRALVLEEEWSRTTGRCKAGVGEGEVVQLRNQLGRFVVSHIDKQSGEGRVM